MAEDSKKLVIEIDQSTYSVIEEFSEYMNEKEEKVIDYLLKQTLDEFVDNYTNLKNGYVEMGKLNLEISRAFTVSENEALDHIDRYELK